MFITIPLLTGNGQAVDTRVRAADVSQIAPHRGGSNLVIGGVSRNTPLDPTDVESLVRAAS